MSNSPECTDSKVWLIFIFYVETPFFDNIKLFFRDCMPIHETFYNGNFRYYSTVLPSINLAPEHVFRHISHKTHSETEFYLMYTVQSINT